MRMSVYVCLVPHHSQFTLITHPEVEPTSNRAERAQIAGYVVQRMIVETLRNGKGTSIHERIMTVLAALAQAGSFE